MKNLSLFAALLFAYPAFAETALLRIINAPEGIEAIKEADMGGGSFVTNLYAQTEDVAKNLTALPGGLGEICTATFYSINGGYQIFALADCKSK